MSNEERIAVSSWSLHRLLGVTHPHDLDRDRVGPAQATYGRPSVTLAELPEVVGRHGIHRLEICSYHLRSTEPGYVAELKSALVSAGVTLQTLLIEAGDISDPATAKRDVDWISRWVEVAEALGAENARVIAGKQKPTHEALDRSAAGLREITRRNVGASVKVVTENWFDLLATPEHVNYLLDRTEGTVGLNGDFGNWKGPGKYEALSQIFGRASICHAKASFASGRMDGEDFGRCIDVAEAAGYKGPYTLIFDNDAPGEWDGIAVERSFVLERLGG